MESINERHKAASHNYREMQNNFEGEKISIKETINTPYNSMIMFNQSQKTKQKKRHKLSQRSTKAVFELMANVCTTLQIQCNFHGMISVQCWG